MRRVANAGESLIHHTRTRTAPGPPPTRQSFDAGPDPARWSYGQDGLFRWPTRTEGRRDRGDGEKSAQGLALRGPLRSRGAAVGSAGPPLRSGALRCVGVPPKPRLSSAQKLRVRGFGRYTHPTLHLGGGAPIECSVVGVICTQRSSWVWSRHRVLGCGRDPHPRRSPLFSPGASIRHLDRAADAQRGSASGRLGLPPWIFVGPLHRCYRTAFSHPPGTPTASVFLAPPRISTLLCGPRVGARSRPCPHVRAPLWFPGRPGRGSRAELGATLAGAFCVLAHGADATAGTA
jgi:hypothetical protein